MKKQYFSIIIAAIGLSVTYTNCGQVGEIALKSIPVEEASLAPEEAVQNILTNCRTAASENKLLVLNQKVNFEDSRIETGKKQICEFASHGASPGETADGNLVMHDSYMQSRYEQFRKLNLPTNAVLCDIEMKNDLQSFRYDDVFFFTFNGFLLASNNKSAVKERLSPISKKIAENSFTDIYNYNWKALRTARFENIADDYCVGASEGLAECSWPVSEKSGSIKFSFAQPLLISMSASRSAQNQEFSFVITGDNDPDLDCYHQKLEFSMAVKYYIPE